MNQILKVHAYERIDAPTYAKIIGHAEAAPGQFEHNRKATVICFQASGDPCTSIMDKLAYVVTIGPGEAQS